MCNLPIQLHNSKDEKPKEKDCFYLCVECWAEFALPNELREHKLKAH